MIDTGGFSKDELNNYFISEAYDSKEKAESAAKGFAKKIGINDSKIDFHIKVFTKTSGTEWKWFATVIPPLQLLVQLPEDAFIHSMSFLDYADLKSVADTIKKNNPQIDTAIGNFFDDRYAEWKAETIDHLSSCKEKINGLHPPEAVIGDNTIINEDNNRIFESRKGQVMNSLDKCIRNLRNVANPEFKKSGKTSPRKLFAENESSFLSYKEKILSESMKTLNDGLLMTESPPILLDYPKFYDEVLTHFMNRGAAKLFAALLKIDQFPNTHIFDVLHIDIQTDSKEIRLKKLDIALELVKAIPKHIDFQYFVMGVFPYENRDCVSNEELDKLKEIALAYHKNLPAHLSKVAVIPLLVTIGFSSFIIKPLQPKRIDEIIAFLEKMSLGEGGAELAAVCKKGLGDLRPQITSYFHTNEMQIKFLQEELLSKIINTEDEVLKRIYINALEKIHTTLKAYKIIDKQTFAEQKTYIDSIGSFPTILEALISNMRSSLPPEKSMHELTTLLFDLDQRDRQYTILPLLLSQVAPTGQDIQLKTNLLLAIIEMRIKPYLNDARDINYVVCSTYERVLRVLSEFDLNHRELEENIKNQFVKSFTFLNSFGDAMNVMEAGCFESSCRALTPQVRGDFLSEWITNYVFNPFQQEWNAIKENSEGLASFRSRLYEKNFFGMNFFQRIRKQAELIREEHLRASILQEIDRLQTELPDPAPEDVPPVQGIVWEL